MFARILKSRFHVLLIESENCQWFPCSPYPAEIFYLLASLMNAVEPNGGQLIRSERQ